MNPNKERGCEMSKKIFETAQLGNLTAKNRLVRSATWEGVATPEGGITPIGYDIYQELACGGVGTIVTGFTSVSDTDHYIDGMMRLSNDALIPQARGHHPRSGRVRDGAARTWRVLPHIHRRAP
jgi:2,4-dienoyl-CoA reductase-like NADH-dependent reductase (Old Yellow Enzyme family)